MVLTLAEFSRLTRWRRTRHGRPLRVAAGMGFDVALVQRDPSVSLQMLEDGQDG